MTERLYYIDSYLTTFQAKVVRTGSDDTSLVLDRTAFYPSSGGQPHDIGEIAGVRVIDVVDERDEVVHLLERPLGSALGEVTGVIDWPRRFDHMQQHTGQHLLSAVLMELYGARTVSFHMGADACTIELETAGLDSRQLAAAELRANAIVADNRAVSIEFEDAAAAEGLRKPSDRSGTLRIISIDGLDRSACGGTHVYATGEIGCILLRGVERIRGNLRLEFLCGSRAIRRARADYESLSAAARSFSVAIDEVPRSVAAQMEKSAEADKSRRKLALELAGFRGRQLYADLPASGGAKVHVCAAEALGDDVRAEAQAFTSSGPAVFVAHCANPASILVAVSKGGPLHAGNILKAAVTAAGGRGGGSAEMAQGSVPGTEALDRILAEITRAIR